MASVTSCVLDAALGSGLVIYSSTSCRRSRRCPSRVFIRDDGLKSHKYQYGIIGSNRNLNALNRWKTRDACQVSCSAGDGTQAALDDHSKGKEEPPLGDLSSSTPRAPSSFNKAAAYKQENLEKRSQSSPAQLSALEKAAAYRKSKGLPKATPAAKSVSPQVNSIEKPQGTLPEVEIVAGKAFSASPRRALQEEAAPITPSSPPNAVVADTSDNTDGLVGNRAETDLVSKKPASESASDAQQGLDRGSGGAGKDDLSIASLLAAFDSGESRKMQAEEMIAALRSKGCTEGDAGGDTAGPSDSLAASSSSPSPSPPPAAESVDDGFIEIEFLTRDGVIKRKVARQSAGSYDDVKEIRAKGVTGKDFMGLGFADKKSSSDMPAGLRADMDRPSGALPQVEILTRDAGQGDESEVSAEEGGEGELYKPKVSTWGVFPRPRDISRTYGGGRTIRPGESLETAEEKAAREARTKKLLDDYRIASGMDIDPQLKAACDKALKAGGEYMEWGNLRDALEQFEIVVSQTKFRSELHGKAALQKAVCLDSLARSEEAKELYERLVTHPNDSVRRKARQLIFGFQAAEKLRVRGGYTWDGTMYRRYFDAFADGYNNTYKATEEDGNDKYLQQALPYTIFLLFPIVLVIAAAFLKHSS